MSVVGDGVTWAGSPNVDIPFVSRQFYGGPVTDWFVSRLFLFGVRESGDVANRGRLRAPMALIVSFRASYVQDHAILTTGTM